MVTITVGCGTWTAAAAVVANLGTTAGTFVLLPPVMTSDAASVVKGVYRIEGVSATKCP